MNERIQKLIEQATSTQGPTPYNPLTFEVFDKEKFAELIVRECAGIVSEHKDQAIDDGCNVDEAMSVAEMDLLEHFGVE